MEAAEKKAAAAKKLNPKKFMKAKADEAKRKVRVWTEIYCGLGGDGGWVCYAENDSARIREYTSLECHTPTNLDADAQ